MTTIIAESVSSAEAAVAGYFGRRHAVLVGSGTAALSLLYEALGLPEASRVVYPDVTCETAVNAAIYCGLEPVFVDVEAATATFDLRIASKVAVAEGARAVVPTHIFGHICDVPTNLGSGDAGAPVIVEDAAQGYGGTWRGRKIGALALHAIVSFGPGKFLDLGGGGALVTDDPEIARRAYRIRSTWPDPEASGRERKAFMRAYFEARKLARNPAAALAARNALMRKHRHGYIARLDETLARRLVESVAEIDTLAEARRKTTAALDKVINRAQSRWPELIRRFAVPETTTLWRFTFQVAPARRKTLVQTLRRRGLQVSQLFAPMHRQYLLPDGGFPVAVALSEGLVNICFDEAGGGDLDQMLADGLDECFAG